MAGRFPREWLDELRARTDIVQVVSSYVALKKNGHRYMGLCPFHNETAPSFTVDETKQVYYCFGCKAGGSVVQFIMDIEKMDYLDAVRYLADQVRLPLPEMRNDPDFEQKRSLKERIYEANRQAARIYHSQLWTPEGAHILSYLKQRGLSDAIIRRFGIGASLPSANVGRQLQAQGFTQDELIQAGLMMRKEGPAFDMFRNRAIFPILDAYGNVLAFGGRALGDEMPKYLNTGDTSAFNKRFNVFAANFLRKEKNLNRVILVEGYMDVVSLYQYGMKGVAATLGTALTAEQAKLLKRFAPEIQLCYDGDRAGQQAILRGLDIMEEAGVPCRALVLPGGLDPDEYIRQEGLESFLAIQPISPVQYRMQREKEKHDLSTEEGRTRYAEECAKLIARCGQPVEMENHLKRLAVETGFSIEALKAQIGISAGSVKTGKPVFVRSQIRREDQQLDRTQSVLLALMASGKLPKEELSPEMFEEGLLRQCAEALLSGKTMASFLEELSDEESRNQISAIAMLETDEDDETLMEMVRQTLASLKQHTLMKQINAADDSLSLEEAARMLQARSSLNQKKE